MKFRNALVLAIVAFPARVAAQEISKEDPAHQELRDLKNAMVTAFNERKIDDLLKHVDKDARVTWQNAEICYGPDEVRKFYSRMMEGKDSEVASLKSKVDVDRLSVLYNDGKSALAAGSLDDDFELRDGSHFPLKSRWTASLVKKNDAWKVIGFHVSTNMFDNGVLRLAIKRTMYWSAGIGAAAGLLLGVVGALVLRRRRRTE